MNTMTDEEFVNKLVSKNRNNETKLQKEVQRYLVSKGCYEFKVHGSAYMKAGIPDIICCYKGLFLGIETKVGKNKQSKLQVIHEKEIISAGGIYILAYSLEDVKKVIETL